MLQWLYAFLEDILSQLQRLTAQFEWIELFLPTTTVTATAVATATATAVAMVIISFSSQHYATFQFQVLCEQPYQLLFVCIDSCCATIVEDM